MPLPAGPPADCQICPRLAAFRAANRLAFPSFRNAPAPTFGNSTARLAIIGLAPGLKGANATGRPFTGDYAGELLYETLIDFGFAAGQYRARADDGLRLVDCAILNAVRCVPPQNKPLPLEIAACRPFLVQDLAAMGRLTLLVALGRIAHESLLRSLGVKLSAAPFAHGAEHIVRDSGSHRIVLLDSYHCSRYNTNTGVLTRTMFRDVFARARALLDGASE